MVLMFLLGWKGVIVACIGHPARYPGNRRGEGYFGVGSGVGFAGTDWYSGIR